MARYYGQKRWRFPVIVLLAAFFVIEVFACVFLNAAEEDAALRWWPLAFGALWAVLLTGLVMALPGKAGRIVFGVVYFITVIYAGIQTGYHLLFRSMMWITEFRYASEGADYFSVILQYPLGWWLSIAGLVIMGVLILWRFPERKSGWIPGMVALVLAAAAAVGAAHLPQVVFEKDASIQFAGSDYGRAQSAQAAYENMFNAHRLYKVCGIYQTGAKDLYANFLFPLTPGYRHAQAEAREEIGNYFDQRGTSGENEMTGIFEGKNVVLVLMESMDDWAIGEHTPTLSRLMAEGINFTNFYTPGYGGVRTFNTEFCINTGSFLSSAGGYAFDYVTNDYEQSLASRLTAQGYSAKVYHYNDPSFYSRGVFSPAMGYGEYVCYADYVTEGNEWDLYDDQFLFDNQQVSDSFFREGPRLNFIITRSAHLSYIYNEMLSYWGLQKYPEYRGMTGDEEEDCMYLKARLVDDVFTRLLQELEQKGELDNTVIVGVTDHYTYGFKDEELMMERSGVDDVLLLEKTPCFIWSADGPSMEVEKTLNTSDLLPTLLNMLGLPQEYPYLGQDAFDENYIGYALFPDGSWICDGVAYSASSDRTMILGNSSQPIAQLKEQMTQLVQEYVHINNRILKTDYYRIH